MYGCLISASSAMSAYFSDCLRSRESTPPSSFEDREKPFEGSSGVEFGEKIEASREARDMAHPQQLAGVNDHQQRREVRSIMTFEKYLTLMTMPTVSLSDFLAEIFELRARFGLVRSGVSPFPSSRRSQPFPFGAPGCKQPHARPPA